MQIKLLLVSVIALALLSSAAMAVEITVDDSGDGNYTTIQDAVNAANDSDTIIVYPEAYNENVDVNKSVIIISQSGNPDDTKVQAASSADYVFNVTRNNVTISGFNITNAAGTSKAGIFLDGVQHSVISDNKFSKNYYNIFLNDSRNNELTGNIVSSSSSSGIQLVDSSSNVIYNNYFNNTINIQMSDSAGNSWNIAKMAGPNIVGGPSIGGNYWAHPDGTGHSQIWTDANNDGFCDSEFNNAENNNDY
ncbi:MAG: right-handed parallel beta-helix repeat-containing protein, partial [Methanohalophilus sp.]